MSAPASSNPDRRARPSSTAGDARPHDRPGDRHSRATFDLYVSANARLDALIKPGSSDRDLNQASIRARAIARLDRLRAFLAYLGNPQNRYPIVHVAGTSGKGSTATATASILSAAGYRVGLHVSPYLQVATEKLQLDGRLIAADAFGALVDDVLAAADAWAARATGNVPLTYGEVWAAMTFRWLAQQRVDCAVIEVGAGGRYDLTNVLRPAVSVITTISLDHTATLGNTIAEIAWHKAGIIKPGGPAVTAVSDPVALTVLEAEAAAVNAPLVRVTPFTSYPPFSSEQAAPPVTGPPLAVIKEGNAPLPNRFQAVNAGLAVAAVRALSARGFPVSETQISAGLAASRLPGRLEAMPPGPVPPVVLDGAHNPEKIAALVGELASLWSGYAHARPVVVLGALGSKDMTEMARALAPAISALVATVPDVLGKASADPQTIVAAFAQVAFAGPFIVERNPETALDKALLLAKNLHQPVLATGSLYVIGALRGRWYRPQDIVREQTPWPRSSTR